jgi:general secretion pathway protein G
MRKAFTLVELLVVIAIISILTIITVSQFQTARRKANDVERKGNLSALSKALFMYYADHNSFPLEINGVGSSTSNFWCSSDANCEFKDVTNYSYMKVLPKEKNSSLFPFCYKTDGKSFELYAGMENTVDMDCKKAVDGTDFYKNKCGHNYCFALSSPNIKAGDLP